MPPLPSRESRSPGRPDVGRRHAPAPSKKRWRRKRRCRSRRSLADDRTNKLIIICTNEAFRQITLLMRELDVPESSDGQRIHVLSLKHADAEELAQTLSSLAQGGNSGRAAGGRASTATRSPPQHEGARHRPVHHQPPCLKATSRSPPTKPRTVWSSQPRRATYRRSDE